MSDRLAIKTPEMNVEVDSQTCKAFSIVNDTFDMLSIGHKQVCFTNAGEFMYGLRDKTDMIGVMYSGGYDSLAHVLRILENTDDNVYPIVNDVANFGSIEVDKNNQMLQFNILSKIYPGRIHEPFINIAADKLNVLDTYEHVQQPFNCLGLLVSTGLSTLKQLDLCYIMGDEALSYKDELFALYDAYGKCISRDGKRVPMVWPDIKIDKQLNVEQIGKFAARTGISLPVTTCENGPWYEYYILRQPPKKEGDDCSYKLMYIIHNCCECNSCHKLASSRPCDIWTFDVSKIDDFVKNSKYGKYRLTPTGVSAIGEEAEHQDGGYEEKDEGSEK
jgi:hypothetical protein